MTQNSTYILYVVVLSSRSNALRTKHIHCVRCSREYTAKVPTLCERRISIVFNDSEEYVYTVCFSSYLFSTRRTSRDFLARSAASRPKQRPLPGLTYSTLKFMRSTCGKSKLSLEITLWERSIFTVFCAIGNIQRCRVLMLWERRIFTVFCALNNWTPKSTAYV